jgi:uncharacterized protein (TIGR03067 family)
MKPLSIAVVIALAAVAVTQARAEDADALKKEMARLEGEWQMTSGVADGTPIPDAMLPQVRRVCKGDQVTTSLNDRVIMKATIKIDPSKNPKTIDYAVTEGPTQGQTHLGIYALDADTFKSCFAAPGGQRPTDFTSKAGDQKTSTVWKRQPPATKPQQK